MNNEICDVVKFEVQKGEAWFHRGQTSEVIFALFSGISFNIKSKHGQGCIK